MTGNDLELEILAALNSSHCRLCCLELQEYNIPDGCFDIFSNSLAVAVVRRNLIVLKSAREVSRWSNKIVVAKLPKELCLLLGQYLVEPND
jgi:hypothetical protein